MAAIDSQWYPPSASWITDLSAVVNGTGVHGFVFNNSNLPEGVRYGTYNWCNMPHVRSEEYVVPGKEFDLIYVEVIHRHHKRTPYAANTLPQEPPWSCTDTSLFTYASPSNPPGDPAAQTYWNVSTSPANPFSQSPAAFPGSSCEFPQISRQGLEDSYQHGKDLYAVYHDLLNFLPDKPDGTILYRVTNNVITSQVAGMVVKAMFPTLNPEDTFPLQIQPVAIDSLEPAFSCPAATALYANYGVGSTDPTWTKHLQSSTNIFQKLDTITGISANDTAWHKSFDHYFDNLSAKQCHGKILPCKNNDDKSTCVTQDLADAVYRLGQHEYSLIYRTSPHSLRAATSSFGAWIAELTQNMRDAVAGGAIRYRHNIAHDGSLARLLSLMQVDVMVWPGMGSEIVFEVYRNGDVDGKFFVRVLWGGVVFESSNPALGRLNMVSLDVLVGYFEGLVGVRGGDVVTLCNGG